jgi:hypothetical protein
MRFELIQELWRGMYGDLTVKEVCDATEHFLRTRTSKTEEEIAVIIGKFLGNLFKARENLSALKLEGEDG